MNLEVTTPPKATAPNCRNQCPTCAKRTVGADTYITLGNRNKTRLRLGDILYVASQGNFVYIHTSEGRHVDWQPLNHYENLLDTSDLFKRTHRSYMANRLHVVGRRATELTLSNGHKLPIANTPTTKTAVHDWLDQWLNGDCNPPGTYITLANRDKTRLYLGDILYVASQGNFVHIHTSDGRHVDWQPLSHYETLLDTSDWFKRTHRSYMVNRLHVVGQSATELTLSNGDKVPIGTKPATKKAVQIWLDNNMITDT